MAKYKELNKKDKIAFWVGAFLAVAWLVATGWLIWRFALHLYHHEWIKADAMLFTYVAGWFWNSNRMNKKKVKKLEAEVADFKTQEESLKGIRKSVIIEAYKQGYQAGIDFQRKVLTDWVEQKTGRRF